MRDANRCLIRALFGFLVLVSAEAHSQSMQTIAGGGSDDGRPGTVAAVPYPIGLALDSAGNLFISSFGDSRIQRVSSASGLISTVAGTGSQTFSGDNGPATVAGIALPRGVAVDSAGNVYIADSGSERVRKIAAGTGIITTVAGGGTRFTEGALATEVAVIPYGVSVDRDDNLYIADFRFVDKVEKATGTITTVAGSPLPDLGDNGPATQAHLGVIGSVAIDAGGNLFIGDGDGRVRRVDAATKIITTVAGGGEPRDGRGDGLPATTARIADSLNLAVAVDSAGNIYVTEPDRVRKVSAATGVISTYAGGGSPADGVGDHGPATQAVINAASGLIVDRNGDLLITESSGNRVRRVSANTGVITTVAGNGFDAFVGDNGPATAAELYQPHDVAVDAAGNLFITDQLTSGIRKVAAGSGVISTIPFTAPSNAGFPRVLAAAERNHDQHERRIQAIRSEGASQPATDGNSPIESFGAPTNIAVDTSGNLYYAYDGRVRKVATATGKVTVVAGTGAAGYSGDGGPATAAQINSARGLAVDAAGNLFIADTNRVRKVSAQMGTITTVTGNGTHGSSGDGGAATAAEIVPNDVAVDAAGTMYIADNRAQRVRRVSATTGIITTVAGGGPPLNVGGDGTPATSIRLVGAEAIAVDTAGDLYIMEADYLFFDVCRIRKVSASTGIISTVVGSAIGFSGDHGPATAVAMSLSWSIGGIDVDKSGNLFISDTFNNRVRAVYACVPMTPPRLLSPREGETSVAASPALAFSSVNGAFSYDIYIDTVNPPQKIVATDVGRTIYSPSNLEPLIVYYWRVVAKNDPLCSPVSTAASDVQSFTTRGACSDPGPVDAIPALGSDLDFSPRDRIAGWQKESRP